MKLLRLGIRPTSWMGKASGTMPAYKQWQISLALLLELNKGILSIIIEMRGWYDYSEKV